MKKCIDKAAIENILHKLWKKDTGYEYVDIARIAYNRALQDVQREMDALEVQEEPVSEDLEKAVVEAFKQIVDSDRDNFLEIFKTGTKWKIKQLITKAIEGNVLANGMDEPILHLWDKGKHLINKKVKVVVIEED